MIQIKPNRGSAKHARQPRHSFQARNVAPIAFVVVLYFPVMTPIMGNKEIDPMTARVLSVAAIALDLLSLSGSYSRSRFGAGGAEHTAVLLASDERYLVFA
ncbi:hypothetical protein V4R08_16130 (plasmid) [Nitrobacter sp. NHB1]|uniref:hypothetical protein n=1 Tax=Nitrobacter sp. NHB1 TaxID=3119830 RepID=UPI002FFF725A